MSPDPLFNFYGHETGVTLIPVEHLTPDGVTPRFAHFLRIQLGWPLERCELVSRGFTLYWRRTSDLARRDPDWAPPRLRHLAVIGPERPLSPYVQLLNTSAWTVFASDIDESISNEEFLAFVLVHGDRMVLTGEVTQAALRNAAYWFDRTEDECSRFRVATRRATRPDADAYRAVADALPWLRELNHSTLRPPPPATTCRALPHSSLLVPTAIETLPPELVRQWTAVARAANAVALRGARGRDASAVEELCEWLRNERPPLVVCSDPHTTIWRPDDSAQVGAVRAILATCPADAVLSILDDLDIVAARTTSFLNSLCSPDNLPRPEPNTQQRGYVFLHTHEHRIAYSLHEPRIDRLHAPAIPFARAMLAARTIHEWAHLAVDAGWVPSRGDDAKKRACLTALIDELNDLVSTSTVALREATLRDLEHLTAAANSDPGTALVGTLMARMPDYQANLLSERYLTVNERETYVRHNVRTLRDEYTPAQCWRMLVRYLYEFQYLRFSRISDPAAFFLQSTWFDADYFESGLLNRARFDRLADLVACYCDTFAVDESYFKRS